MNRSCLILVGREKKLPVGRKQMLRAEGVIEIEWRQLLDFLLGGSGIERKAEERKKGF